MRISRRHFVQAAGAGLLLPPSLLQAGWAAGTDLPGDAPLSPTSKVALTHGNDRRKNITAALTAIDDQIKNGLQKKKYIAIKVNNVSTEIQLAATHVDALHGILDYLEPRYHGPVMIVEASAGDTLEGFDNFHYNDLAKERRAQKVSLIDLNREGKYELISLIDADLHISRARLAARLLDPDAYVISSSMLKMHNSVVATMSVKNMVMGSPLHSIPGEAKWSDKRKFHVGVRPMNLNMLTAAQKLRPNWGLAVIDGFEGMEGDGPSRGTAVASHVAVASTDFVAADRVGLELMGVNPDWVGYLNYCSQSGMGQYDLTKIEVIGPAISSVARKYQLHPQVQKQLQWMGPLNDPEPKLGRMELPAEFIYG